MKTVRIRQKIKKFLGDRPRTAAEILEHINSTMRHGTTSQHLEDLLFNHKDFVKVGYIKRSGSLSLSGGYDIGKWATRIWVADNCPGWEEDQPIILDVEGNVCTLKAYLETKFEQGFDRQNSLWNFFDLPGPEDEFDTSKPGKYKLKKYQQRIKSSLFKEPTNEFTFLVTSYIKHINTNFTAEIQKEYFIFTKTNVAHKKIQRKDIIHMISAIIIRVGKMDHELRLDNFSQIRKELEGALPLATSIKSQDLVYLILTLLGDLCIRYGAEGSEDYFEKSKIVLNITTDSNEDDDWMLVLS